MKFAKIVFSFLCVVGFSSAFAAECPPDCTYQQLKDMRADAEQAQKNSIAEGGSEKQKKIKHCQDVDRNKKDLTKVYYACLPNCPYDMAHDLDRLDTEDNECARVIDAPQFQPSSPGKNSKAVP